ncbi:hypothetical protein [Nocardioides litoris]|nr:hypothetical protein [Nocardioides litoris]
MDLLLVEGLFSAGCSCGWEGTGAYPTRVAASAEHDAHLAAIAT